MAKSTRPTAPNEEIKEEQQEITEKMVGRFETGIKNLRKSLGEFSLTSLGIGKYEVTGRGDDEKAVDIGQLKLFGQSQDSYPVLLEDFIFFCNKKRAGEYGEVFRDLSLVCREYERYEGEGVASEAKKEGVRQGLKSLMTTMKKFIGLQPGDELINLPWNMLVILRENAQKNELYPGSFADPIVTSIAQDATSLTVIGHLGNFLVRALEISPSETERLKLAKASLRESYYIDIDFAGDEQRRKLISDVRTFRDYLETYKNDIDPTIGPLIREGMALNKSWIGQTYVHVNEWSEKLAEKLKNYQNKDAPIDIQKELAELNQLRKDAHITLTSLHSHLPPIPNYKPSLEKLVTSIIRNPTLIDLKSVMDKLDKFQDDKGGRFKKIKISKKLRIASDLKKHLVELEKAYKNPEKPMTSEEFHEKFKEYCKAAFDKLPKVPKLPKVESSNTKKLKDILESVISEQQLPGRDRITAVHDEKQDTHTSPASQIESDSMASASSQVSGIGSGTKISSITGLPYSPKSKVGRVGGDPTKSVGGDPTKSATEENPQAGRSPSPLGIGFFHPVPPPDAPPPTAPASSATAKSAAATEGSPPALTRKPSKGGTS